MIDYQSLLQRFMANMWDHQGDFYNDDYESCGAFSQEEIAEIRRLECDTRDAQYAAYLKSKQARENGSHL